MALEGFILKDPTASVRTRQALASLGKRVVESLVSHVKYKVAAITVSLTTGVHDYTVTVTGAGIGDIVLVSALTLPASSVASWVGTVSAADTVTVRVNVVSGPGGTSIQPFLVAVLGL